MAELESMKYFSEELTQQVDSEPEQRQPGQRERLATAAELGMGEWTLGLSVVMAILFVFGAWGSVSAIVDLIRASMLASVLEYHQNSGGGALDGGFTEAVAQARLDNYLLVYLMPILKLVVGLSFMFAAYQLGRKQYDANRFAALTCIGAVFYGAVCMVCEWVMTPNLSHVHLEGVDTEMVLTILSAWMVASFAIRGIFYGGVIAYLLNKNNRRLFAHPAPTPDSSYANQSNVGQPA